MDIEEATVIGAVAVVGSLVAIFAAEWIAPYVPHPSPATTATAVTGRYIQSPQYRNVGQSTGPILNILV